MELKLKSQPTRPEDFDFLVEHEIYYVNRDSGFLVFSKPVVPSQSMAMSYSKERVMRGIDYWGTKYASSRGCRVDYLMPKQEFFYLGLLFPFIRILPVSFEFPEAFLNVNWYLETLIKVEALCST